jgi:hypothetical protein
MSSEQFNLQRMPNGDVLVRGGVIVDLIASPTTSTLVGYYGASGIPPVDDISNSFFPALSLSGGSGRNIFIPQTGSQTDIPFGTFFPLNNNKWINGNGYDFSIEIDSSTGQVLIKDSVNTVAIANPGRFRLHERAQCSLAQASGGPGTATKTIDLGTGTGTCSFQFTSSGTNTSMFNVVWNSTTVINVTGSGTVSFNKNLTTVNNATVTVFGGEIGSSWSYNLGCPGGAAPPYNPPAIGTGPVSFTASSTTYGNSLNGGTAFNLTCTFENGTQGKTAFANSIDSFGINLNLVQDGYSRYYESVYRVFEILIKSTGAELRDAYDVIAIRPVNDANYLTDPSGTYESTAYGLSKFGLEENFFIDVNLNNSLSMDGVHVYQLRFSSGVFTRAEGPIFINGPIPSNTSTLKYLPVGSYDSASNILLQLWEGPILLR